MAVYVSKTKILTVKGKAKVESNGTVLEETAEMKDVGLIITSTLSWTENATNKSAKALKTLCSVKGTLTKITTKATKIKSYKTYIAPIVSYGSSLWKPSKRDLKIIESVQKKETAWILSPTQEYKDRLISLHILPLSLYHELHIPLLLLKIRTGKTELQRKKFISVKEKNQTRYASMKKHKSKQFRLQKSESDFFVRACNITNVLNEHLKFDVMEHENIKELITNISWRYFKGKFNENDTCSWRIDCRCMNCKTIRTLNF